MMFFGFMTILFILYMVAAIVALVGKIKKVIVKDTSQDLNSWDFVLYWIKFCKYYNYI